MTFELKNSDAFAIRYTFCCVRTVHCTLDAFLPVANNSEESDGDSGDKDPVGRSDWNNLSRRQLFSEADTSY